MTVESPRLSQATVEYIVVAYLGEPKKDGAAWMLEGLVGGDLI